MLVLSRKKSESITIGDDIIITVIEIRGDKVRLGIEAPKEVPVHRREVFDAVRRHSDLNDDLSLEHELNIIRKSWWERAFEEVVEVLARFFVCLTLKEWLAFFTGILIGYCLSLLI
jgi:carbon storage regulator